MTPETKPRRPPGPPLNRRTRRGFSKIVRVIMEDFEHYDLLDPGAPWIRLFKGGDRGDRGDIIRALKFIKHHANRECPGAVPDTVKPTLFTEGSSPCPPNQPSQ